jgi:acyl dehydratase
MIVHLPLTSLAGRTGEEIGVSDWLVVSQARIDQFADATGDHQWIHQDAARAATESPYGTTIAHGFLTLSLATALLADTIAVDGARMIINYGCDRVRFVSAVPAGSRVRGRFTIAAVDEARDSLQVTWGVVIEREGLEKPSVVLDWKVRYYPAAATA